MDIDKTPFPHDTELLRNHIDSLKTQHDQNFLIRQKDWLLHDGH